MWDHVQYMYYVPDIYLDSLDGVEDPAYLIRQQIVLGQVLLRAVLCGDQLHLRLGKGVVLLMEIRGVGGNVQGFLLCDDCLPRGVHPVQKLAEVRRLRGGRGGGLPTSSPPSARTGASAGGTRP